MNPLTNSNESLQRIVVGVDFTSAGECALQQAVQIARLTPKSEVHPTYVIASGSETRLDELNRELQARLTALREHVEQVCAPHQADGPFQQAFVFHVRVGDPAPSLHQVAVDVDASMIVVGTHGRRGVGKLLLGSVAEEILRIARLPVLVALPRDIAREPRSERPEPARPGEDLHGGLTHRAHIQLVPRTSHISGLL